MHRSADNRVPYPRSARMTRLTRLAPAAVMVAALAFAGAACSDDDDSDEATPGSTAAASTTTAPAAATTTSAPAGTSGPTTSVTIAAAALKTLRAFQTPTGNIVCFVDPEDGVDCEIGEYSFSPPPKEASCELDWGQRLSVGPVGAGFGCYGDTLRGDPQPVLAYGEVSRVGTYECVSRQDGLRCTNLDNGRGFVLSRARYEFF